MSKERFCPECGQPADADERFAGIAGLKSRLSQRRHDHRRRDVE